MKPLSPNLKYILPRIRKARRILLLLDYDGTLTPIVRRPDKALLSPKTKTVLKNLIKNKCIILSVVTGRSIKKIKALVGLSNIYYAGNHGLEIGFGKSSSVIPEARKSLSLVKKLSAILKKELWAVKNAEIEDKGVTISVHYRRVSSRQIPQLKKIVSEITQSYVKSKKIIVGGGKKIIEIRPPVKWDKGKYCLYLLKKFKGALPVYIGDDITDEDAFKALKKKGITIFVRGEKKTSCAQYYVTSIAKVAVFLKSI
ncbi:MAG: trehalose-phosphatase [Candidatus Omnitrophota bacterium]